MPQGPTFCINFVDLADGVNDNWTGTTGVPGVPAAANTQGLVAGNSNTARFTMGSNNFSLAAAAVRVTVAITWNQPASPGTTSDVVIRLTYGGATLGNNKAANAALPTVNSVTTYDYLTGASGWGATITQAMVNDPTFGVDVMVNENSVGDSANIGQINLTVYTQADLPDENIILKKRGRQKNMGYFIKQSSTAQPLYFWMYLSTDHLTPATGLTPTVTLRKPGGAFAAAAGAVTEVANGLYQVAGNATDTNTLGPLALHATGTGADAWDDVFEVVSFDPQDAVRMGLTSLPNAAAGANLGLPTVDANNAVKLQSGTGANQISLTNGLVSLATNIRSGTAQAGAAGSITLDAGASATDNFYKDCWVEILSGTGAGQVRYISGYTGATKVATVAPNWLTAPDNTSGFVVLPAAEVNAASGVTYPTNFAALAIDVNGRIDLGKILGTALTETLAGQIAAAFKKWFDVSAPAYTLNNVNDAYARIGAGGAGLTSLGDTRLAFLDAAVSTRLAAAAYAAPLNAAGVAAAVLDANTADHATAGTVGAAIASAGSAGDPWATLEPGSYAVGTFGHLVATNLDAAVSSRSTFAGGAVASVTGAVGSVTADVGITQAAADKVWATAARTLTAIDKVGYKLASDGLDAISIAAPAGTASNFREMLVQLWRRWFKKSNYNKTTGEWKTFADDGTTVVTTQVGTDDGTTQTLGASA